MKLSEYTADHVVYILLYVLLTGTTSFFLAMFRVSAPLTIAIHIVFLLFGAVGYAYGYFRKKSFYDRFLSNLEQLDKKYLITELVGRPGFYEGQLIVDALYEIDKSMTEELQQYAEGLSDFKEYIELWVHEVKLPIASAVLMVHNHPAGPDKKLREQLLRIESYVEQVLYYVRSENAEKDYLIRETPLNDIVRSVIRRNKDSLLLRQIAVEMDAPETSVCTDAKWLEFILNQIVSNAVKYSKKENAKITFAITSSEQSTILTVRDNGVGIAKSDLARVFTHSFTGENGRRLTASTGMGLYLCKKLCGKLGHDISIQSKEGEYTQVSLAFGHNKYVEVARQDS